MSEMPELPRKALTRPSRRRRRAWAKWLPGYLFISPWVLGFVFFTFGPMVASLLLSQTEWDLMRPAPIYIGLDNFRELVRDPLFYKSLVNTLYYASCSVPLTLVGAFVLALILNQRVRGVAFFRTLYYLPAVTSGVAVFLLWRWLFNPTAGLINYFLGLLGLPRPGWLSSPEWAMPALIIMSLWTMGGTMIIYLAGLQGIPQQYYEAAALDGASAWKQLRHVTIPLLTPTIFFNLVVGLIGAFQYFTAAYVMTGGGPAHATLFYGLYVYQNAFEYLRMGYAAALAWILFFIIAALTLFNFALAPRWVHYEQV